MGSEMCIRDSLYLACNAYDGFTQANTDGGFNVIGPNGFEPTPVKDRPRR